jgi:hypothetical protein
MTTNMVRHNLVSTARVGARQSLRQ